MTTPAAAVTIEPTIDQVDPVIAAVAALISELRPDIPQPITESLVREALDQAADTILDLEWARQRAAANPDAIALAHTRHTLPHAIRRARQLAEALAPRPDDHTGTGCTTCPRCRRKGDARA